MRRLNIFALTALNLSLLAPQGFAEGTLVPKSRVVVPTKKTAAPTQGKVPAKNTLTNSGALPARRAVTPTTRTGYPTVPAARPAVPATAPTKPLRAVQPQQYLQPQGGLPRRKIASTDRSVTTARIKYKSHVEYGAYRERYWVGLLGGMASITSADGSTETSRQAGEFNKNLMLGVNGDLRFHRNYGMEFEGYYGLAGTQTLDYQNGITDQTKMTHMGGLVNIKGEYPVYTGSVHWVPKLGVGYGMLMLSNKVTRTDASGAENLDAKESLSGVYAEVGFEVEPIQGVIFSADYAKSLMASGNVTDSTTTTKLDGVGFSRIRVGAYFRLMESLVVGGQYNQRTLTATSVPSPTLTGGISKDESSSQIMGAAFYEF
jgi:hypothetical protein